MGEWDDEDGFGPSITEEDKLQAENRAGRVVVLKHMFTLAELEEDASLLLDLKEDVRDECSTLGEVTNVVLYDVSPIVRYRCHLTTSNGTSFVQQEPEGVMTVKFRHHVSAQACVMVSTVSRISKNVPADTFYLL